jgi:hypothetical protein
MRSQNSGFKSRKIWAGMIGGLMLAAGIFSMLALNLGATDDFAADRAQLNSPPANAFSITPADGADMGNVTRSIWVGTGGDIAVIYGGNRQQVTLKNVPSGSRLPGRFARVLSTGTTASNLIGEY